MTDYKVKNSMRTICGAIVTCTKQGINPMYVSRAFISIDKLEEPMKSELGVLFEEISKLNTVGIDDLKEIARRLKDTHPLISSSLLYNID